MEEKAKILRKEVWLKPDKAPTTAETIELKIKTLGSKNKDKITKGEIFCQVNKIKELIQFKPSITSGNQKCNGAIPNLVLKAKVIIKLKP